MRRALLALALALLCRLLVTAESRRVIAVSVPNCTRLQGKFAKFLRIALGWAGNLRLVFTCSQSASPHFASYLAALRSLDVLSCLAPICPSRSPHDLIGIRVIEADVCGTCKTPDPPGCSKRQSCDSVSLLKASGSEGWRSLVWQTGLSCRVRGAAVRSPASASAR